MFRLLVKIARRVDQNVEQLLTVLHACFALSAGACLVWQVYLAVGHDNGCTQLQHLSSFNIVLTQMLTQLLGTVLAHENV